MIKNTSHWRRSWGIPKHKRRQGLLVSPVAFAKAFNLATPINLLTHYAKGTPLFLLKTLAAYRITNSSLFQIIMLLTLKLSFTVLFTIAKFIILSLRGWFPYIPTSFLSLYLRKLRCIDRTLLPSLVTGVYSYN